jgi:hypothetical protein
LRFASGGALGCGLILMLCAGVAQAQPDLVSPLPHGIVQIDSSYTSGQLRVIAQTGVRAGDRVVALDYRFVDAYSRPLFSSFWSPLRAKNGLLDTTLRIPFLKQTFKLLYRLVTSDSIYEGEIPDLAIGHVIGVAGQSNAEGWSPPPFPDPIGDVRVLRGTEFWEYGSNPSGKRWNGPWVYMANKFRELVPDGLPIGIVNTAKGGTGLVTNWSQAGLWKRNDARHDDPNTIYGNAIRMFRGAGGNMEAICWIQGEADVAYTSLEQYQKGFEQLVRNMEEDLARKLNFYHLQISGQIDNGAEWRPLGFGWIREAQRKLYGSKLVGSAVAYPLSFDGIHYENSTTQAVGHRFAAAIASDRYGVESQLYPPVVADTAIIVDIDTDRSELGKKILLRCLQGSSVAGLLTDRTYRGFELRNENIRFDTARTVARTHPYAPGWIEITLKDSTIFDTAGWYLSYAIRADVHNANVLDTCTASNLPNALVAFLDIPVGAGKEPPQPEPQLGFDQTEDLPEGCLYRWFDLLGKEVDFGIGNPEEMSSVLAPGPYLFVKTCGHQVSCGKWLVLPR